MASHPATFHFVNFDCPHDIRSHVMREYWRQKKSVLKPRKTKSLVRNSKNNRVRGPVSSPDVSQHTYLQPYEGSETSSLPISQSFQKVQSTTVKNIVENRIEKQDCGIDADEADEQLVLDEAFHSSSLGHYFFEQPFQSGLSAFDTTWRELSSGTIDPFNAAPIAMSRADQDILYKCKSLLTLL